MEVHFKDGAVTHGIISRQQDNIYGYHGWPSLCVDENGVMYAVCSGLRMRHICPFGKTVMYISRDHGTTWTPPIIVNDTALDDRDAGIISLGGGKLLVSWFSHPADVYLNNFADSIKSCCTTSEAAIALAQLMTYHRLSEETGKGGSFVRLSRDNGVTWGETIQVPVSAPHGPIMLSDGTLLYLGKELYSRSETPRIIAAYSSADDGLSWAKLATVPCPQGYSLDNFHEPHVLELPGGRLLGAIRAQSAPVYKGFSIFTCFSDDGGRTWTPPQCIETTGSPPHLMLHSSGAIICSYGRRTPPYGERAVVSYDNGLTWEKDYVLFEGAPNGDLGYPASVELPDKSIFTLYYQQYGNDSKTSLLYTKWRLD